MKTPSFGAMKTPLQLSPRVHIISKTRLLYTVYNYREVFSILFLSLGGILYNDVHRVCIQIGTLQTLLTGRLFLSIVWAIETGPAFEIRPLEVVGQAPTLYVHLCICYTCTRVGRYWN
jgi:hypothetical protein